MNTTMRASTVGRARRKPKTYAENRVCGDDTCSVKLSRYNRAEFCFNHSPAKFPRLRGEFTAEYAAKQSS